MRTISFLILFLTYQNTFAHNPFWVRLDKNLITGVAKLDKKNAKSVEQFFIDYKSSKNEIIKENLGFGWSYWGTRVAAGYISISAGFYYNQDSIVSFTILPELPEERGLIEKYKKWYGNTFSYEGNNIRPFQMNEKILELPLPQHPGRLPINNVSKNILKYMSPHSGTMYGYSGGLSNELLSNREAFLQIENNLTNDEAILIMYSINPASRLTAIEYYKRNKERFSERKGVEEWIQKVFQEVPKVQTLNGCLGETIDARVLVYKYSGVE